MGILTGPDGMGVEYSAFMAQMIGEEVLHEGVRLLLQLVSPIKTFRRPSFHSMFNDDFVASPNF